MKTFLSIFLVTFAICFQSRAEDQIKGNSLASIELPGEWSPDMKGAESNIIFRGSRSNQYLIFAAWPIKNLGADTPGAALKKLNTMFMDAAREMSRDKAKITDFEITEEAGQLYSGHFGAIPSKGLVFFRRLVANEKTIVSLYVEYTGFTTAPDFQGLTKEFLALSESVKIK